MSREILKSRINDWQDQNETDLQWALVEAIWGLPRTLRKQNQKFFLEHYLSLSNCLDERKVMPINHTDTIDIIEVVKLGSSRIKRELMHNTITKSPNWLKDDDDDDNVRYALDYAVSLWLMLNPRGWLDDQSICDFAAAKFPRTKTVETDMKLTFDAFSLQKIAGIYVIWTSRLDEHLELNMEASVLRIFCHASLLDGHRHSENGDVYPEGLLRETAMTIALLFPSSAARQRSWLRRNRKHADLDIEQGLLRGARRDLDDYDYWQARLKIIQSGFDQATPRTLSQWFYDRRDGYQWITIWLTCSAVALTILFGLSQAVTGIVQVVLSYNQLRSS